MVVHRFDCTKVFFFLSSSDLVSPVLRHTLDMCPNFYESPSECCVRTSLPSAPTLSLLAESPLGCCTHMSLPLASTPSSFCAHLVRSQECVWRDFFGFYYFFLLKQIRAHIGSCAPAPASPPISHTHSNGFTRDGSRFLHASICAPLRSLSMSTFSELCLGLSSFRVHCSAPNRLSFRVHCPITEICADTGIYCRLLHAPVYSAYLAIYDAHHT